MPTEAPPTALVGSLASFRSGICCALSGLYHSIRFATQGNAVARETGGCVLWAGMLRPFQGDWIRMPDENRSSARHGNATPWKSQIEYGGHIYLIVGDTRSFLALYGYR